MKIINITKKQVKNDNDFIIIIFSYHGYETKRKAVANFSLYYQIKK